MNIFNLLLFAFGAVPVLSGYLTASSQHRYESKHRLLMRDVFISVREPRAIAMSDYIKQIFQNFACHIYWCAKRRESTGDEAVALIQRTQNQRLTYCTRSFHPPGYFKETQHNTLNVQIMQGFIIQFHFLIFHFEWRKLTYSGVFVSGDIFNKGKMTTYFTGVRLPWKMIITNSTAQITISNFAYLTFSLDMYYIACKMTWFNFMQYVNSSLVPEIGHLNIFPLFRNPHKEYIGFSYNFIQNNYKPIIFSVKSMAKSNANVYILDGPGVKSRLLLGIRYLGSHTSRPVVTTTFYAYVHVNFMLTSDILQQALLVNFRTHHKHVYEKCDEGDSIWMLSNPIFNTICTIPFRQVNRRAHGHRHSLFNEMWGLTISRYLYIGRPLIFTTGNRVSNCQYGGLHHFPNIHESVCQNMTHFTFLYNTTVDYLLVVWLPGYSRGSIFALSYNTGCVPIHLDSHALIYNQTTVINNIEHCRFYILPAPLSTHHSKYSLKIKIPGRPIGTASLRIAFINAGDKCVPGFGGKGKRFINVSTLSYNNSQFGRTTFSIDEVLWYDKFSRFFEYLIRADINLPLLCQTDNQFLKPIFTLKISTCLGELGLYTPRMYGVMPLSVNKIVGMTKPCENSIFWFGSFDIVIYHEDYNKNHTGYHIDVDYGDNCPAICKNYTYTLKVYHRYNNRAFIYSANVGDYIFTKMNHQGFWLKIKAPNTLCPLTECAVWFVVREWIAESLPPTHHSVKYNTFKKRRVYLDIVFC